MRIDAFHKINKLYSSSSIKCSSKSKNNSFRDMLEISQTGKEYQIAKQVVAQIPDVREDRVNDIKERMKAGTYNITMEDVADKLVNQADYQKK